MSTRRVHEQVAANILAAAEDAGLTLTSVAEATDVTVSKLVAHPSAGELEVVEMERIGGLFRVPVSSFFKGVNA